MIDKYQPEPPSNQDWDGMYPEEPFSLEIPAVTQEGIPLELPEPPEGGIVIWQIEVKYFRQYSWQPLLASTFFTREGAYEKICRLRLHDNLHKEYRVKQTHYMPVKVVILKQDESTRTVRLETKLGEVSRD